MKVVNQDFLNTINSSERIIEANVVINGIAYDKEKIIKVTVNNGITNGDTFTIGETFSGKANVELYNVENTFKDGQIIEVTFSLDVKGVKTPIKIGKFYISKVENNGGIIKLEGYDKMYFLEEEYISGLVYPTSITHVMNELKSNHKVNYTGILENVIVDTKLQGYSIKQIIGFVASIQGKNAIIDKDENVIFVSPLDTTYSIGTSQYFTLDKGSVYKITGVTCKFGDVGHNRGDNTGNHLTFINPWVQDKHLDLIFNRVKTIEFVTGKVKYLGNFALEPSDLITVNDGNSSFKMLISNQTFTYSGGFNSDFESIGEGKSKSELVKNKFINKKSLTELTIEMGQIKSRVEESENNWSGIYEELATTKRELHEEISAVDSRIDEVLGDISGALGDGIIDEAEANMIASNLLQLDKDKKTIDKRYSEVYGNTFLKDPIKTDLLNGYNQYNASYTSLVATIQDIISDSKATDEEKTLFDTKSKEYNTKLSLVYAVLEKALDNIAENKVDGLDQKTTKKFSEIKQTTDDITLSVGELEEKTTTLDNGLKGHETRLKTAEEKITPEAITSTVRNSEEYKQDLGTNIRVIGSGFNNSVPAEVFINNKSIYKQSGTGFHFIALNKSTYLIEHSSIYNTHANPDDEFERLMTDIRILNNTKDCIMCFASFDSLTNDLPMHQQLLYEFSRLGITIPNEGKGHRQAFAGIGYKNFGQGGGIQRFYPYSLDNPVAEVTANFHDGLLLNGSDTNQSIKEDIAQIVIKADGIEQSVKKKVDGEVFESYKTQTAKEIANKITSGEAESIVQQTVDGLKIATAESGNSNIFIEGQKDYYFDLRSSNAQQSKPIEVDKSVLGLIQGKKVTMSLDVTGYTNNIQENFFVGFEMKLTYTDGTSGYFGVNIKYANYLKPVINGSQFQRYVSHSTVENKAVKSIDYCNYYIRGFNGEVRLRNVCINFGHNSGSYTDNSGSLVQGITRITGGGITVTHSQSDTYSNLSAEGLKIFKNDGTPLASFGEGNKAIIGSVEADVVNAENVIPQLRNKGTLNCYVSPTATGDGSGRDTNNRANSVARAIAYLFSQKGQEWTYYSGAILSNTAIVVNVVGSGTLSENVYIKDFLGEGRLEFNVGADITLTGAWEFRNCNALTFYGNRKDHNTNNGATFRRNGNYDSLAFYSCKSVHIDRFRFSNSVRANSAISCRLGTHIFVQVCDFYQGGWALWLDNNSIGTGYYLRGHNFGSGAYRAFRGSILNYEQAYPNGNLVSEGGGIINIAKGEGVNPYMANSLQAAPPAPSNKVVTQDFTPSSYKSVRSYNTENGNLKAGAWDTSKGNFTGYCEFGTSIKSWLSDSQGGVTGQVYLSRMNDGHGYSGQVNVYINGTSVGSLAHGEGKWFNVPAVILDQFKSGARSNINLTGSGQGQYIKYNTNAIFRITATKPV